jgi:hypothetical protein
VFVDKKGNPNIVFRGTVPRRTKDLVSDLSILTGLEGVNPRFKESKDLTKEVERKYISKNILMNNSFQHYLYLTPS